MQPDAMKTIDPLHDYVHLGADGATTRLAGGEAFWSMSDAELDAQGSGWLVAEFEFDSVHESTRHKSGLALRFPRFHRIRWDKPADEADEVATLKTLMN